MYGETWPCFVWVWLLFGTFKCHQNPGHFPTLWWWHQLKKKINLYSSILALSHSFTELIKEVLQLYSNTGQSRVYSPALRLNSQAAGYTHTYTYLCTPMYICTTFSLRAMKWMQLNNWCTYMYTYICSWNLVSYKEHEDYTKLTARYVHSLEWNQNSRVVCCSYDLQHL